MNKCSLWKDGHLVSKGLTEPEQQVAAKDIVVVEDWSDEALPSSIDDSALATILADLGGRES